jgi:hypothetical protein
MRQPLTPPPPPTLLIGRPPPLWLALTPAQQRQLAQLVAALLQRQWCAVHRRPEDFDE